ncbi:MAG: hypothetical protein IKF07_03980 [Eubacterium sp.]|nr:hypothetical protein [Eubacterium sp.]
MRSTKALIAVILTALAVMIFMPALAFAEEIPEADQFGQVEFYSTAEAGTVLKDSYRYSDRWFTVDPAMENKELALLSMQFVAAAVENDADGLGADLLKKLGFDGIGYRGNPDLTADDCDFTYGAKRLDDGSMLVAVAVRSYAFDQSGKVKGWPQNFSVNGESAEGEHYMLSKVAEAVVPEIAALGGSGDVRYWITGQSRGGALAGLIASKLPAQLGSRNKGIYAYTFESPRVVQPKNDVEKARFETDYNYIHNYVCSDDLVTAIPPWGMVRYGVDHMLNTDEADSGLEAELERLGSRQEIPDGYNREDAEKLAETVLLALQSRIPTREDYSKDHSETIKLGDGTEQVITYNYQDILGKLMVFVFGGALDDADLSNVAEYLRELLSVIDKYMRGYLAENGIVEGDPQLLYWEAASTINPFLKEKLSVDLKLSDGELYALLKLAAPVIIDKEYIAKHGYNPDLFIVYIAPALKLPSMLFSHHFDSLIARLHTLAPEAAAGDIALMTEAPEFQDPATKMPRKIRKAVTESPYSSWLTASSAWITDDKVIANKKVYYLSVKFTAAGRVLTDDQKITINGEEPVSKEINYEGGMYVATCVWKYTIGVPNKYKLSFSMNNHGEQVPDMEVENGAVLKYVERPADPVAAGYRFGGWVDTDEIPWDEITVDRNQYLDAVWVEQVDKVKITFMVPRVGQKWSAPAVPSGAPYYLDDIYLLDRKYNDVETIKNTEKLTLSFNIRLKNNRAEFPYKIGRYDNMEYTGTVTINGEKVKAYYDEGYLRVEYKVTPLAARPKLSKSSITIKKGKTAKVKITGKENGTKNTYKNTKIAKVVSKKTASTLKIKGLKKGKTTLKIKVDGTWLKLKVRVK